MDKKNEEVVEVVVPSEPEAGTEEPTKPEASQEGVGNAKTNTAEGTPASQEPQTQRNLEAEAGKMSALEKERNDLKTKLETATTKTKGLDVLNKVYEGSPETYESFRTAYKQQTGEDLGSYESRYGGKAGISTGVSQPAPLGTNQERLSREDVRTIAQQEVEDRTGFQQFVKSVPEMDPDNLETAEDRENANIMFKKVASAAAALKAYNPMMTTGEAMVSAYYAQPENAAKRMEQVKKKGEVIGKAKAMGAGAAMGGVAGGTRSSVTSETVVKMTQAQKARYEQLRAKNPKIAKRYADNIANPAS